MKVNLLDLVRAVRTRPGLRLFLAFRNHIAAILPTLAADAPQFVTFLAQQCGQFFVKYKELDVVPTSDLLASTQNFPSEDKRTALRQIILDTSVDSPFEPTFYSKLFNSLLTRSLPFVSVEDVPSFFAQLQSEVNSVCGLTPDSLSSIHVDIDITSPDVFHSLRSHMGSTDVITKGYLVEGLNKHMRGGFEAGTLSLLLGSKGEGKTWAAVCSACDTVRRGNNVLFLSLENTIPSLLRRLVPLLWEIPFFCVDSFALYVKLSKQNLTEKGLQSLKSSISDTRAVQVIDELIKRARKLNLLDLPRFPFRETQNLLVEIMSDLFSPLPSHGKLHVRYVPSGTLTAREVDTLIAEYEPDHVIIDYLNVVHIPREMAKHEALGEFASNARALAVKYNCSILMTAQLRRGFKTFVETSVKRDAISETLDYAHEFAAESIAAIWIADLVLVLYGLPRTVRPTQTMVSQLHTNPFVIGIGRAREIEVGKRARVEIYTDGRVVSGDDLVTKGVQHV